jgi:allantoate deiminase
VTVDPLSSGIHALHVPEIDAVIEPKEMEDVLVQLGRFSAPGPGVTRLAYDEHWCDAHVWLAGRARSMGLAATPDAAGNLFFHDPAVQPGTRVVLVGSHLDTVRNGGLYDGAYGLVCGLFAAADLRDKRDLPVVGIVTAEEEGSRFSGDMMGTRAFLGRAPAAEFDALCDETGQSWRDALGHARARGCATELTGGDRPCPALFEPAAMIEAHVEQGPVLEAEGLAVGIVEHIIGYRRMRARVTGEPRHAGTTPMRLRKDALAAAAEMVLAVEAVAREMGEPAVATAGQARSEPGLFNVVPGACELWIEMRHVKADRVAALYERISARCVEIAARRGVTVALEQVAGLEPSPLSAAMANEAEALARELGVPHRRMVSWVLRPAQWASDFFDVFSIKTSSTLPKCCDVLMALCFCCKATISANRLFLIARGTSSFILRSASVPGRSE